MIVAVELKKYVASTYTLDIAISKFRHDQEPGLVILFLIEKDSEIRFYYIILLLCLTIHLQVKSS